MGQAQPDQEKEQNPLGQVLHDSPATWTTWLLPPILLSISEDAATDRSWLDKEQDTMTGHWFVLPQEPSGAGSASLWTLKAQED